MTIQADASRTLGYQQFTPAASTALTVPAGTSYAIITPLTQGIRWRDDGIAPTATVGYPLAAGSELRYNGANLSALRIIQQTASAEVNVMYYGN